MQSWILNKRIKWHHHILMYFYWVIVILFAIVILFMARTAFRYLLFNFAVSGLQGQAIIAFLEKILVLVVGIATLSFIIFTQDYFYKAIGQNLLSRRFLRILGIEFLTLFVFNTIIILFSLHRGTLLLFPVFEFIIGALLILCPFRFLEKRAH